MNQLAVIPCLTLKTLTAQDLEMELTSMDGDETLEIHVAKKRRTCFLQGKTKLGDDARSGRLANADLTSMIAELIRECPFPCRILDIHLRVSKERSLRFLHEKLE
jgi:hypothetical protein